MTKKDDGSFTFTATSGDFPKKHKAPVINIGIAETGMEMSCSPLQISFDFLVKLLDSKCWNFWHSQGCVQHHY